MRQLDMKQVIEKWNQLLAEGRHIIKVSAELAEDAFWTKGVIMENDIINEENGCYVASMWATPQVTFELEDEVITFPAWEDGENPYVVERWIEEGCPGLDRKYEVGEVQTRLQ